MSTPVEIRKQIKAGKTGPLYVLEGDDLQSRHDLALEFANLVEEGLQAFNVESFYANEATNAAGRDQLIGSLLSTARTLPMMASKRVVIVHEAERLLAPKRAKDEEEGPDAELPKKAKRGATPAEELEAYVENPEPMTTLVFVSGPLDANRRIVKLLRKHADVVDCGTLHDPREAAIWITKRLEKDELTIEPKAISQLLAATGLTLGRIRAGNRKADPLRVGRVDHHHRARARGGVAAGGVRGDLCADGRGSECQRAARAAGNIRAHRGGRSAVVILGQLRAATIRLRPDMRVKDGLEAVLRTDLAIKSSAGIPQHLLECLAVELCAR